MRASRWTSHPTRTSRPLPGNATVDRHPLTATNPPPLGSGPPRNKTALHAGARARVNARLTRSSGLFKLKKKGSSHPSFLTRLSWVGLSVYLVHSEKQQTCHALNEINSPQCFLYRLHPNHVFFFFFFFFFCPESRFSCFSSGNVIKTIRETVILALVRDVISRFDFLAVFPSFFSFFQIHFFLLPKGVSFFDEIRNTHS